MNLLAGTPGGGGNVLANTMTKPAQCEHVKVNGVRCGSPALRTRRLCYFHFMSRVPQIELVPILEDGNAIQTGVLEIIHAMLSGRLDTKRAALALYGLQIASCNLPRVQTEPPRRRIVLDAPAELDYPYLNKSLQLKMAEEKAGDQEGEAAPIAEPSRSGWQSHRVGVSSPPEEGSRRQERS